MASTQMESGWFLAHSVVPSKGSTAMSTSGPSPAPTSSPMKSIGASSRSPSPITMRPPMWTFSSSSRMPSTAAASAAISSPLPRQPAAAIAARSVTRTISRVIERSMIAWLMEMSFFLSFIPCPSPQGTPSEGFDADQLRLAHNETVIGDMRKRFAHRGLHCRVRN
jgi:hypothetical protein